MKVSLDDYFRIFFVGPTVDGYDFIQGKPLRYDNRTYIKTGSSGAIIREPEAPWSSINTDNHLICWNYVTTSFKSINSYIINVFDKESQKLLKVYEFESKNNEKDFYVSCGRCNDRKNFLVMVSKNEIDRITNEVHSEA